MGYKLVCFDLDGTLVDETIFIWHTLHEYFGTDPHDRKAKADEFFSGKITYSQWAGWEVDTWIAKGACKKEFHKAISALKPMEGAKDTLIELKKRGYELAVISGSLNFVMEKAFPDYLDFFRQEDILINRLIFAKDGSVTGKIFTDYDMEKKALGLKMIAQKKGISLAECIFIGDHNNDLEIAGEAGFSIAFNSKSQRLNEIADVVIEKKDLREILKHIPSTVRSS